MATPIRPAFLALVFFAPFVLAQQPFYTDDADVTDLHHVHLELSNQHLKLQPSQYPSLRQNNLVLQVNYGLLPHLEIGVDAPLLVLFNTHETLPVRPIGFGDTNITLKWNFREEKSESSWPALTVAFAMEAPTGDVSHQLGSGLADYGFNTVIQKHIGEKIVVRWNNGLLLSGNTLTGVVGLNATGIVYSTGFSVTRELSERLLLGLEGNGAVAPNALLGKAALQIQFAGKYYIGRGMAVDFGLLTGHFEGSPHLGVQLGISKDF